MALKKDKQKIIGEELTDERIAGFLDIQAPAGIDADFHVLEKAYRGLRGPDFKRFLAVFSAANRNINATNIQGKTLLALAQSHRNSAEYVEALKSAGAS